MSAPASSNSYGYYFRQISGVPVTIYKDDGSVDYKSSGNLAAEISHVGIRNIIAAGNTGEFFSLSMMEIQQLHSAVLEAVPASGFVTASVGRSLSEAKELTKSAAADGAGAVMVHWPTDPFAGPAYKVDYFLDIADAATIPVVAYVRSDELPILDLVRLAEHPNVHAIKFAATNMMALADAIRSTSHSQTLWVCGLAEGWAPPFYALGAVGFTSGLVNVFPRLSLSIYDALEAGDFAGARALINELIEFEKLRALYNNGSNVTVVKEALEILGRPAGAVRLPGVVQLATSERHRLEDLVERLKKTEAALSV